MNDDFIAPVVACLIVPNLRGKVRLREVIARHRLGCLALLTTTVIVMLACSIGSWADSDRYTEDQHIIESRYVEMMDAFGARDYPIAYGYTSPGYQRSHDIAQFKNSFLAASLEPGYFLWFEGDKAMLYPYQSGPQRPWNGPIYHWIKIEGHGTLMTWNFTLIDRRREKQRLAARHLK